MQDAYLSNSWSHNDFSNDSLHLLWRSFNRLLEESDCDCCSWFESSFGGWNGKVGDSIDLDAIDDGPNCTETFSALPSLSIVNCTMSPTFFVSKYERMSSIVLTVLLSILRIHITPSLYFCSIDAGKQIPSIHFATIWTYLIYVWKSISFEALFAVYPNCSKSKLFPAVLTAYHCTHCCSNVGGALYS